MKKTKRLSLREVRTIESRKDDIIRVTGFKVSPVEAKPGSVITIRMTIKNVSEKSLRGVPWQIVKNKNVLAAGVRYNLPAGDSFKVSVSWTSTAGSHFFYGDADPGNTLREPKIKQYNNLPQGTDIKIK